MENILKSLKLIINIFFFNSVTLKVICSFSINLHLLENYTTYLDNVKESICEMVIDAKTESDSDEKSNINISVT